MVAECPWVVVACPQVVDECLQMVAQCLRVVVGCPHVAIGCPHVAVGCPHVAVRCLHPIVKRPEWRAPWVYTPRYLFSSWGIAPSSLASFTSFEPTFVSLHKKSMSRFLGIVVASFFEFQHDPY